MSQDSAYAAFERDISVSLQEEVMAAMAEATGGWGKPDNVGDYALLDTEARCSQVGGAF